MSVFTSPEKLGGVAGQVGALAFAQVPLPPSGPHAPAVSAATPTTRAIAQAKRPICPTYQPGRGHILGVQVRASPVRSASAPGCAFTVACGRERRRLRRWAANDAAHPRGARRSGGLQELPPRAA